MTWGWRGGGQRDIDGHASVPFSHVDYFHMQDTVTAAYVMLRDILSSVLLPAGNAWARAMRTDTTLDLWSPNDNYHPNLMGSYLAACVFYAVFFHQSPIGLSYTAGLTRPQADFFQLMADQTVSSIGDNVDYAPASFELLQNYPNPFNARTTLYLNKSENVKIGIFDIAGRMIETLSTENGSAIWDASDVSSGLYFARVLDGRSSKAIKMVLLK